MFLGVFFSQWDLPQSRTQSRTHEGLMAGPPLNGHIAATVNENKLWYYDSVGWQECLQGTQVSLEETDQALVLLAQGLRKLHAAQKVPELIEFTNLVLRGSNY